MSPAQVKALKAQERRNAAVRKHVDSMRGRKDNTDIGSFARPGSSPGTSR
jgi:hypothetical protein